MSEKVPCPRCKGRSGHNTNWCNLCHMLHTVPTDVAVTYTLIQDQIREWGDNGSSRKPFSQDVLREYGILHPDIK